MPDLSPDIAPPQPVRLADYTPPAFLIDTVDLVFDLGADDTRVKSRLGIRRNPAVSERAAALHLDGEALDLVALALDGEPLGPNRYQLPPEGGLILVDVPDGFTLDIETRISPRRAVARCCSPTATRSSAARSTGAGIGPNGSIRTPSPPTFSPSSPAIWSPSKTALQPARARRWRSPSGCAAATTTNAVMRWP